MKILFYILLFVLVFKLKVISQPNLVPNGDMESYKACIGANVFLDTNVNTVKWFGTFAYYCNTCNNSWITGNGYNFGVPQNAIGYQNPRSGNAYLAINLITTGYLKPNIFSTYGYGEVQLQNKCINRLKYKGMLYASSIGLSSSNYILNYPSRDDSVMFPSTSNIGIYLNNKPLQANYKLQVKPAQIKNDINRNLNDTVNWMEVSGIFEANGTEQYLSIGIFDDSASIKFFNSYGQNKLYAGIKGNYVSYFIDDVSLIPQNTTHYYDSILCSNAPLQLGAVAQADSFEWNDGNKTDKIRSFTTAGLVWVKSWLYGGTVYMWDSLNIISNNINSGLPKDTFLCNEQKQLNISTTNANAGATYLWNNGSTGKSLVLNNINWVNGKAQVWLTTTANYCTQTDTVTIYQKPALQIPINDTTTCFEDVPQILLDAGANFKSYLWLPTGETSKTVYSNQAQIYKLTVTDSFNCSASKNIIVDELCKAEIFLPNAFTPNGDGKNETYKPILKTKNLLQYQLKIYDSWGREVFSTTDPNQTWDAKNNLQGVYVVTVNYKYKNFEPTLAKGTVTVLR